MSDHHYDFRERLLVALQQSDEMHREKRAERMIAVSEHVKSYGVVMGEADTLAIKEEAYFCFVNGHYIATILLAVSLIEHTLSDVIVESGGERPFRLAGAIETARSKNLFPDDLLNAADRLREIRNPFTHRRKPDDPDVFANRFRAHDMHPTALLEEDAKAALVAMYQFFDRSIKYVTFE
jgi:hypothetical protein